MNPLRMNPARSFLSGLFALLTVVLLFALANFFFPTPGTRNESACGSRAAASLTPAADHFRQAVFAQVDHISGGHPIEGYEPAMIMRAYQGLQPADFAGVEANGGCYYTNPETDPISVGFTATAPAGVQTSADRAITPRGMVRLLENAAHTRNLPIATVADVDALLRELRPSVPSDTPQRVTLEGEYVCLPHKETSGPQTLECAFGLKTDEGSFYALDLNLLSAIPPAFRAGERLRANGILTPIERLSTDQWRKYNVQGIFSITDSLERR